MFSRFLLLTSAVVVIVCPVHIQADSWYKEDWAIAAGGAVAGGLVGYTLGRQHDSAPQSYNCGDGTSYYREKKAFPFYHKKEIYPVLVNSIDNNAMQAVSAVNNPSFESESETTRESPYTINIYIGDNNNDVNVSVTPQELYDDNTGLFQQVTVTNNEATLPGRKVDVQISDTVDTFHNDTEEAQIQINQDQE